MTITRNINGENVKITLTDDEVAKAASEYNLQQLSPKIDYAISLNLGELGKAFFNGDLPIHGYDPDEIKNEIAEGVYSARDIERDDEDIRQSLDAVLDDINLMDELKSISTDSKIYYMGCEVSCKIPDGADYTTVDIGEGENLNGNYDEFGTFSGRVHYELSVIADNIEDAKEKATEICDEANFGDLEDLYIASDWKVYEITDVSKVIQNESKSHTKQSIERD